MKAIYTEKAIKLVLLDAIEKGLTTSADAVAYMQSESFEAAVKRYIKMFEGTFEVVGSKGQVIAAFKVKAAEPVKITRKAKADKVVTYTDIKSKWELKRGYKDSQNKTYNAEVNLTQKTIRIFGEVERYTYQTIINQQGEIVQAGSSYMVTFDRTFELHDYIKTGSYNLIYTDPITNISKSSVFADGKRFDLHTFISYNWDLDLDKIAAHNTNERYYI